MAQSQATNTGVIEMSAEARTPGTKNVARRLRASGRVPAILYGSNKDALALSMVLFLVWLPYASVVYLRLNALCVQAEIADIELGTVRDALRGL